MIELTDDEHFEQISAAFNSQSPLAALPTFAAETQLAAADRLAECVDAMLNSVDSGNYDRIVAALSTYHAIRGGE